MRSRALRERFGASSPAILITADRSPRVRDEARGAGRSGAQQAAEAGGAARLLAQWRARAAAGSGGRPNNVKRR